MPRQSPGARHHGLREDLRRPRTRRRPLLRHPHRHPVRRGGAARRRRSAWSHPALTGRNRSSAIITALATRGVNGDRLLTHLAPARRHGLDDQALTTLMTLLAGYIGYPRASQAMETVHTTHPATPQDTIVGQVREYDDREQFLTGIAVVLDGLTHLH
ncbi:carboxymuconolactone decarboxylase family protein [Streptomyces sp. NBC_01426]|uniref:carboxymuconolactone decarboxylase family protein n=1 Tax=Streptomyces sp. NBC_01426 TaxID=2975866 RepID=UPI002E362CDC|nr:carboxymuconolactone decarboxylase family protein [Streptomyces sp. NBC_01426]